MTSTSSFYTTRAPIGLAFDNLGNLYCSNFYNNIITKITSNGASASTFASGLSNPVGVAFDNLGNLYCANNGDNTISKITSDGTSVSTFVNSTSGLSYPVGVAFDNLGNLYCANSGNNTISKITSDGTSVSTFVNNGLNGAYGLAFDNLGNLYCANSGNNTISKITSDGTSVSTFVGSGLNGPIGLAFDSLGNLYCSNSGNNTISKITSDGTSVSTFVGSGLNSPRLIAFDNSGNLYCANFISNTITKTVIYESPTLSNFSIPTKIFGDIPFTITPPTSNSSGSFSYTSSNLSVATINGNTITIIGAGSSTITATQAASGNYISGTIQTVFQVNQATPTLTNFSIPTKTYGDSSFTITPPTSDSSGSFSYTSSNLSVATINGNTITIIGAGSSTITATQAASGNYSSGTIQTVFQVNQATPTLTNFSIPTKTYGDSSFTITPPTSDSSGSFSYTSSNLSVATINGNTITIIGAGSSTITATQAASGNYSSGTIQTVFQVNQATPTLSNFPNQTFSNVYTFQYPFTYNLTQPQSNSSGAFSYSSSNTQTATVSGNTVTVRNAGNSTITATQAASGNYSAGSITSSLMVSNICFPAGTPITTDQGEIAIEKINPDIHTIRNKKIVDITKTVSTSDFLVCFEKHSLDNNIPSRKTVMTKDHEIFFKGKMMRAIDFMDKYENVHKVKYSGEPLYNVLLEKHDKMMVNNLICETLNPENPIAKVYGMLKSYSVEEQERLIKECNKITVNNNKFSSKQLERINRHI